ncbi:LysR family transcriptional regulator [Halalkalibacter hemicellulosilyticus]|uniref:Transcriptional regulator n=1 Tax=Halalkalibacter hemicellulosilyticusJCM 9152 TaxID=1236971 RepID=W4QC01_9BACI|nr:LysR family transcriptional regulator [Halalkalibacter hemicellulosilyticus]GAE29586.1 transcriptional regulator [Halalkalibacter hemicellulosilyticusJCM 9152]
MNIEVLQHFIKVYEKKSVNSAAKELFITPQGLSKTIKQLEMDLEAELFTRGPRGMEATECGELLHARARHICYLVEDIKKEISIISGKKGVLNVVISYSAMTIMPVDIVYRFTELNPEITLKLREVPDEYPIESMLEEEVDVGLIVGDGADIIDCEYELIGHGEVVVVVSNEHQLAQKDEVSLWELNKETLVIKAPVKGKENVFVEKCLEFGFTPNVKHEFGNVLTAHRLCQLQGLVAISNDFTENSLQNECIKVLKLKEKIPQNVYLITRKRGMQSNTVLSFQTYIREMSQSL